MAPEMSFKAPDAQVIGDMDASKAWPGVPDTDILLDTVDKMKTELAPGPAAKAREFVVYPEAPHAVHADHRLSYRKAAAKDGWQRLLDWLQGQGVA